MTLHQALDYFDNLPSDESEEEEVDKESYENEAAYDDTDEADSDREVKAVQENNESVLKKTLMLDNVCCLIILQGLERYHHNVDCIEILLLLCLVTLTFQEVR